MNRQALAMHLVLLLASGLLASQVLRAPDTAAVAAGESATPWGADYFPNTLLTDQDGRQVRFFDDLIKGKVVVINFIFTSCSEACPLETARLRQVQSLLGDRVGRDVFFYSISIDPLSDTPEVLDAYARRFKVGPGWRFLTGDFAEITELRRKLGLFIEGVDNGRSRDHNLSLIVGNQQTGRWMKASPFENPWILADQLGNSLQNWKQPSHAQSYASAPEIRPPSSGEELFRTRCASCHSLGPEDGQNIGMRSIGPDLIGVTEQRDPAWLSRWIREPDRLLAERDPLALALFERYDRIPMPNLHLDEQAVQAIIAFLREETARQRTPMAQVQ
ncbi:SCO family protein [Pseudomonas japonica]|uniref:Cytochrome oxidase Cu insertion factor, SCO1/SenC/PrrC family n=1 Tax=Pseudomonas japonica TaxID=256466 RepID=A0A239I6A5_9PSED|nr:SCO family protein [Pseudomonas japonica]SNS88613.1 Cytochrome oxidase Cu insertion factor, SCO1/SenC/PrrC family [Pseudomonas japonica]